MKLKKLTLENYAKYNQISVNFDENVTYLIGPNGAGKSSLGLNGLWFVLEGIAEKAQKGTIPLIGERFRFIGEKTAFAKGEAVLYDEKTKNEITVTRHMTKDASKLTFSGIAGIPLDQDWLNTIFNVFLISPQSFIDLNSKEQSQVLNIDTSVYDKKITDLKADLTLLNKELKTFGDFSNAPEKVEKVDVMELQKEKEAEQQRIKKEQAEIDKKNEKLKSEYDIKCADIELETDKFNSEQNNRAEFIQTAHELLASLIEMGYTGNEVKEWIAKLPKPQDKKVDENNNPIYNYPEEPKYLGPADDSKIKEIDNKILLAGITNEKALTYRTYLENLKKKIDKEKDIDENKKAQKNAEQERIDYLKACRLPFDNSTIDEEGKLMLDGRPIREPYFSTGELLKIVPILIASTMNPDVDKLKYVYLQRFNLLDDKKQTEVVDYLVNNGFQLVIEYVGEKEITDKNCIVLKDMKVINRDPEPEKKEEEPKNLLF